MLLHRVFDHDANCRRQSDVTRDSLDMKDAAKQMLDDCDIREGFEVNMLHQVIDLICGESQGDKNRKNCSHLRLMADVALPTLTTDVRIVMRVGTIAICCTAPTTNSSKLTLFWKVYPSMSPCFNRYDAYCVPCVIHMLQVEFRVESEL